MMCNIYIYIYIYIDNVLFCPGGAPPPITPQQVGLRPPQQPWIDSNVASNRSVELLTV